MTEHEVELTITVSGRVPAWIVLSLVEQAQKITPLDGQLTVSIDGADR